MQTIQLHSKVDADGVLSLTVPMGEADANSDVIVTIQSLNGTSCEQRLREWRDVVTKAYGSCADLGLERPEQGTFELREELA